MMSNPGNAGRVARFLMQWALCIRMVASLSVDGVALITFKNTLTSDPYNTLGDWNASHDTPCAWSGIACADNSVPRVVGLELVGKKLGGTISPALGALTFLQTLKLQGNILNGSLPEQLFNATSLQTMLLGGNRLTGALPSQISKLVNLRALDLSSNSMLGIIPQSLTECVQLQTLVLARNFFSGPLPEGLGTNLTSLEQLDLSSNLLHGPIPSDLGKLSALQGTLNLSYNHLSGSIPLSLGNLPYTVSLDLSHNNLSGRIPQDGSLSEQGPGPFLYNPRLCGFPLAIACPVTPFLSPLPSLPTEGSSPSSSQNGELNSTNLTPKKPNLSTGAVVAITVGDAVGVSLIASLFVYLYWKARRNKEEDFLLSCMAKELRQHVSRPRCFQPGNTDESETSESSEKGKDHGDLVALDKEFSFDIDELLRASAFVLGKSGLGIVYKVVLGNGTPIAVRRIGEGGSQKRKEFETEVQAVGKLRHSNIVRLLAYYWSDDEKLLIYEFISHGSLATALHGHSQLTSRALTWEERLRIARGVARGLAYLHELSPRKYVHGDIKTANILLDGVMHPYIADFGLARLASIACADGIFAMGGMDAAKGQSVSLPYSATHVSERTGAGTHSSGSYYRAPEAVTHVKPTQKWDVYAYGVVVMEILRGRSVACTSGIDMVAWIRKVVEEESGGILSCLQQNVVDPAIAAASAAEHNIAASVTSLLKMAVACTSPCPDQRPKMRSIADSLDKLILLTSTKF